MEIQMKVTSCSSEWVDVMKPISENGQSRKRSFEESFMVILEPGNTTFGSADMYSIGKIQLRLPKPLLPGDLFTVTINAVGAQ